MSWSYDPTLTTDRDQVRFQIGDTDTADQLLSDEELDALLLLETSVDLAAARAADRLAIEFIRKADEVVDDLGQRVKYGNRAALFQKLATAARSRVSVTATVPVSTYARNQGVW